MFARGTSPVIVLPIILFLLAFFTYMLVFKHWLIVLVAVLFWILSMLGINFFRDPHREIGKGVVSAADGTVTFVRERDDKVTVSVFMNVHNVHVNRAPLAGKVLRTKHHAGGHVPAYKEESRRNEQFVTDMKTDIGRMRIVQIAGTVARRIVPYIEADQRLSKGERIGIIKLGSRVDVTLPASRVDAVVKEGQKVMAGTTTIARLLPKLKGKKSKGKKEGKNKGKKGKKEGKD